MFLPNIALNTGDLAINTQRCALIVSTWGGLAFNPLKAQPIPSDAYSVYSVCSVCSVYRVYRVYSVV